MRVSPSRRPLAVGCRRSVAVRGQTLAVHVPAVPYAYHVDFAGRVVYFVHNPVVADPDTPVALAAGQLSASGRPGVFRQRPDARYDPPEGRRVKPPQVALSAGFEENDVHAGP